MGQKCSLARATWLLNLFRIPLGRYTLQAVSPLASITYFTSEPLHNIHKVIWVFDITRNGKSDNLTGYSQVAPRYECQ